MVFTLRFGIANCVSSGEIRSAWFRNWRREVPLTTIFPGKTRVGMMGMSPKNVGVMLFFFHTTHFFGSGLIPLDPFTMAVLLIEYRFFEQESILMDWKDRYMGIF